MTGFGGCSWYLKGQAGLVYNLISGPEDSLNTLLVPANLTDKHHKNDGTFHGGVFIWHGDHNVTATVDEAGRLKGTFHVCLPLWFHLSLSTVTGIAR